ncbi:MAG: sterol desaturase family protein [Gammaproteobacteria bacterium]
MGERRQEWNYIPELPLGVSPLWQWPPKPLAVLKWYWDGWFLITVNLMILGLAVASWRFFAPSLETAETLSSDWIAQITLRNLALLVVVAGVLHLYFYAFGMQGREQRFDSREMPKKGKAYTLNSQLRDNIFWSCTSGVLVWSAYEVLMTWCYANGYLAISDWDLNPFWFLAIFFLIPIWESFYFYWIHRFLHWPPLYRIAHSLHHRNTNIGPWSGLSMHPIEHLIYFSSVLIHFAIVSHPVHMVFHLQFYALVAVTTHTGFDHLFLKNKNRLSLGTFHHQMHHRYFECNYGNLDVPWDILFGSFHDGTEKARDKMRARLKLRHKGKK